MDLAHIKKLIRLVETSGISELEINEEGLQIRISKQMTGVQQVVMPQPVMQHQKPAPGSDAAQEAKIEPAGDAQPVGVIKICSPMVGTFYRASSPDAEPYINTGDTIQPGKVLCIVEAMKLMNEIESEVSGKIVKILVENAQPVEYNQPLFWVETT